MVCNKCACAYIIGMQNGHLISDLYEQGSILCAYLQILWEEHLFFGVPVSVTDSVLVCVCVCVCVRARVCVCVCV